MKNKQKRYSESIRKLFTEKNPVSRSVSLQSFEKNESVKLPRIPNHSAPEKSNHLSIKREKMMKYAESIKRPPVKKPTTSLPPIPPANELNTNFELTKMEREHMLSMKDVECIRRQLNLQ
jgi:hypothetical protein